MISATRRARAQLGWIRPLQECGNQLAGIDTDGGIVHAKAGQHQPLFDRALIDIDHGDPHFLTFAGDHRQTRLYGTTGTDIDHINLASELLQT
jgi:hypothetical protein